MCLCLCVYVCHSKLKNINSSDFLEYIFLRESHSNTLHLCLQGQNIFTFPSSDDRLDGVVSEFA